MRLLDHVSIAVRDLGRVRGFYDAIFTALEAKRVHESQDAVGYGERNRPGDDGHTYLSIYQSSGADAGAPGLRPHYHPAYYAAFLMDPEGNRIEAVCHQGDGQ